MGALKFRPQIKTQYFLSFSCLVNSMKGLCPTADKKCHSSDKRGYSSRRMPTNKRGKTR